MHRDISVGNLLKLVFPAIRKLFTVQNERDFVAALKEPITVSEKAFGRHNAVAEKIKVLREFACTTGTPDERMAVYSELAERALKEAHEVERLASKLGASTECKAIVSDGDLAAYMPTYFTTTHEVGTVSVSWK